jgi:uncharacterized protein (TIGR03437 family)
MVRLIYLIVAMGAVFRVAAQPTVGAVLNGASYSGTLSPGCWAVIYGSKLAPRSSTATQLPLPTNMEGVSVSVAGIRAPLLYVASDQLNFLIPFEVAIPSNGVVPLTVTTGDGVSPVFYLRLVRNAPAVFTADATGSGRALAFDSLFQPVERLGKGPQEPIVIYATGLGPTNPPATSFEGGSSTEPFNRAVDRVQAYFGEIAAPVQFAGLAPGFPGVYQLNVVLLGRATDRLYLRIGNWQSNVVHIPITAGANVASVSGSVDALYPTAQSLPIDVSILPLAGKFSLALDLKPDAAAFEVQAVGEVGSAWVAIDPATKSYRAVVTVPNPGPRVGDFSLSEFSPIFDFTACLNALCEVMPGNVIPVARIDPAWPAAIRTMPLPNASGAARGSTAFLEFSGSIEPGGRFVIDDDHHPELAMFAGFLQISAGLPKTRSTSFQLYVDGTLIASKDVTYAVVQ